MYMEDEAILAGLKRVGQNIFGLRCDRQISLGELSEQTNLSVKYLRKIEDGKCCDVDLFELKLIADCLGVKIDELFKGL